jgi:hypothetical protein
MSDAPAAAAPQTEGEPADHRETFDALAQALRDSGPVALLDLLIHRLDERGEYRALLDAKLLKARFELGLPLIQSGSLAELDGDARAKYEDRYVEAIRTVGQKLLDAGDIPAAWPYFRAIGETDPIARAIDAYSPSENDERLGQVVEVAFNQGANPRKGFALILQHYGTCSSISAFEGLPRDEATRSACADMLVRQLHEHLTANLRADIAARGQPLPTEGTSIPHLIAGRDWLFVDDAYHIDVSHLSSTVRISPLLSEPSTIALALELTEYGRKLSGRHRYEGDPPFADVYEDHRMFLRALLGQDVDASIAHFTRKLEATSAESASENDLDPERPRQDALASAQVLVGLLARIGRLDEAIDVAAEHLAGVPEASLFCPGVPQLCQRAGQPDKLARIARHQGDLVSYAAAILQRGE